MPEPDPDSFAPGVLFEAGDSWIENVVHLEIPIQKGNGRFVKLPVYLAKQKNSVDELVIWMKYSDKTSGAETLQERLLAATGEESKVASGRCDAAGEPYGPLSTAANPGCHLQSPDEFVMDFSLFRGGDTNVLARIPAALEEAGVISYKRVGGQTMFGEAFNIYGVNF